MNCMRWPQTGRTLLLVALGVGLQVRSVSAQALEPEHDRTDEFKAAKLMMQEGRPNAATLHLQSMLSRHPDHDSTRFSLEMLLAEAYETAGNNKLAAQILEGLLPERPNSADVRFRLAGVYRSLG